jgi:tetratricopeptide (TPR) repeat protein
MSEKLVRYLDGELSGNEKTELEQQLAADKELQEELESLKLAKEAIRNFGLKQRVSGVHEQMMSELQTPVKNISSARRILRYSMAVAAGVVFIFMGIIAYNYFSLSADKLFKENYQSYELGTARDGATTEVSPVEKAYREKKYADVTTLAKNNDKAAIKDVFLIAMSYLELNDNNNAIANYKKVLSENSQSGSTVMKDEAEYYLALTYIRSKEYGHALEWLTKIHENTGHLYYERVTDKLIQNVKSLE